MNGKVYVVNKSAHDFSEALKWGEIIFMSEGPMNRYAVNNMHRLFTESMKDSHPNDHIVPCSLNVMNIIAGALFAKKHGTLNLLLFNDGEYVERNLII